MRTFLRGLGKALLILLIEAAIAASTAATFLVTGDAMSDAITFGVAILLFCVTIDLVALLMVVVMGSTAPHDVSKHGHW